VDSYALVVSDLVDSTALVTALGDRRAAEILAEHDHLARELLAEQGGREIDKSDGFLLLFEDPHAAFRWVRGYHAGLAALSKELATEIPLRARAGVHVGEVILRTNRRDEVERGAKPIEVEGVAKVIAARLMGAAGPGRTFFSSAAANRIHADDLVWDSHGEYVLRGIREPIEILEARAPGDAPYLAPPDSAKARRATTSLGDEPDAFIGRSEEHRLLELAVEDGAPVVTLFGPAGTGKTRLARRFAREQAVLLEGGAGFADLTDARDLAGITNAVARMLEVELVAGDPIAHIGRALAGRGKGIYVLDNAEQVVEALARVLVAWTAAAPEATFVVTSREILRVQGEHVLAIGPLTVPPRDAKPDEIAEAEAVALFTARITQVQPQFELTPDVAPAIAEIVRQLDGIPLAIELAAARGRTLSPAAILERLPRRFDLLSSARRDTSARHATLRRAIDWSWGLLLPWERMALACTAVFSGGFDLDAAEAIVDLSAWRDAPFVLDVVQALADKSLLRAEPIPGSHEIRYSLYESIREYAEEQLMTPGAVVGPDGRSASGPEAAEAAMVRHGRWFARLADPTTQSTVLASPRRLYSLDRGNLRIAIDRAIAHGDVDIAGGAGAAELTASLYLGPMPAGIKLGERLLRWEPLRKDARAHLAILRAVAPLHHAVGQATELLARTDEMLPLAQSLGDTDAEAFALCQRGVILTRLGDLDGAAAALDDALDRSRGGRFAITEAQIHNAIGIVRERRHDMPSARAAFQLALALARGAGHPEVMCHMLISLGDHFRMIGRPDDAKRTGEEALQLARTLRARRHEAFVLSNLGDLPLEAGRPEEAGRYYRAALAMCREMGFRQHQGWVLSCLCEVATWLGQTDEAESFLTEAWTILDEADERMLLAATQVRRAFLAFKKGQPQDAQKALQDARRRAEPADHTEVGRCWARLQPIIAG
jgi:predicted ATPase/class 3 adenylate cyclase